jgi:hypothetical protein
MVGSSHREGSTVNRVAGPIPRRRRSSPAGSCTDHRLAWAACDRLAIAR